MNSVKVIETFTFLLVKEWVESFIKMIYGVDIEEVDSRVKRGIIEVILV